MSWIEGAACSSSLRSIHEQTNKLVDSWTAAKKSCATCLPFLALLIASFAFLLCSLSLAEPLGRAGPINPPKKESRKQINQPIAASGAHSLIQSFLLCFLFLAEPLAARRPITHQFKKKKKWFHGSLSLLCFVEISFFNFKRRKGAQALQQTKSIQSSH